MILRPGSCHLKIKPIYWRHSIDISGKAFCLSISCPFALKTCNIRKALPTCNAVLINFHVCLEQFNEMCRLVNCFVVSFITLFLQTHW